MPSLFAARDYRRPQAEEQHEVAWCAGCGYGRVLGRFSPGRVAAFYDIPYYTHGGSSASQAKRTLTQRVRRHLAWRFDHGKDFNPDEFGAPSRVVDLGCGNGGAMKKLAAAGFSVVGVEPDPRARRVAETFGEVCSGTVEELPREIGRPFDCALMSHVLEHTIRPEVALKNVHALLNDQGKLIVEVPNCEARGFATFGPCWPWTDVPRHLHFFTQRSLARFLESAGFRVTKVLFTGFTRQFDVPWIDNLNAIHDVLRPSAAQSTSRWARQSWALLLRAAMAADNDKYDSIRMHAVRV